VPWLEVAEMKVAPLGQLSLRVTAGTLVVVALLTVIVYVALAPELTDVGPVFVREMSGGMAVREGVTTFDCADSGLSPTALLACTVKVYAVPLLRPPTLTPVQLAHALAVIPDGTPATKAVTV
jgi:hypothetical protein